MRMIPQLLVAALGLHLTAPTGRADEKPEADWRSVIQAHRDPDTGFNSIKVNDYLLRRAGEPRQFSFLGLWRYDADQKKWRRVVTFPAGQTVTLKPGEGAGGTLVRLPEQVGLFWAEWKEDGRRVDTLAFSGPILCNDVAIGEPPEGMIATCVPFPDRAVAMFVPDPREHCRE